MRVFTAIPVEIEDKPQAHVTLNFFGEISEQQVETIKRIFQDLGSRSAAFTISYHQIKQFRDQVHAVIEKTPELMALQAGLETAFRNAGFKFQNRPYYPHITLRNLRGQSFQDQQIEPVKIQVDSLVMFQSVLYENRAEHIPLLEVKLQP